LRPNRSFDSDPYPGRPRILFIGHAESSHTHAWIDLLHDSRLNVRLFALPTGAPPPDWSVKTYITSPDASRARPEIRRRLPPARFWIGRAHRAWQTAASALPIPAPREPLEAALASVLAEWRPDIVHTLGFDPAAYFYATVATKSGLRGVSKWVAQARGGPDLALNRYDPRYSARIQKVLLGCDYFVADNEPNYAYARSVGLPEEKLGTPPLGVVPGTGGLDVDGLARQSQGPPSQRPRRIVWPKAYETASSKALPVFEALRLAWSRIAPCEVQLLWLVQPEVRAWFHKMMPREIQVACRLHERLPRDHVLRMLAGARVMLAPSLTDGVPNSMLEAMALGAFPIVSPLETITPVVAPRTNVLFARNLYPEEVAAALVEAMTDDALVDGAASRNLAAVRARADRRSIGPRVVAFYEAIAASGAPARARVEAA
jgi:glycosyltransferase involved in cell wall biosynthesis